MPPSTTERRGHRGSAALRRLIELAPATGSLALWMRHRDVETLPRHRGRDTAAPCANDGRTVYYTPTFETLEPALQRGLLAHEILHVALQHAPRRAALERTLGDVDETLYTVAADAIVNSSLAHLDWLALPPGAVTLERLLERVLGEPDTASTALSRWDVESLYRRLDDRRHPGGEDDGRPTWQRTDGGEGNGADGTDGRAVESRQVDEIPGRQGRPGDADPTASRDGPRARVARAMLEPSQRDLLDTTIATEEQTTLRRQWTGRLERAHAEDGDFSLLRTLLADRREAGPPWRRLLRTRLTRALAPQPSLSWSRPSRSWLATRGRGPGRLRLPWQPGIVGTAAVPRLVIMVDVSGSIESDLLGAFAGEIERIRRLHRNETRLIAGDHRVRLDALLKPGGRMLRELGFEGGAGTDLTPLLQAADRHAPDIGVFLTDLQGPVGFRPAWPVVWALPATAGAIEAPFGTRVLLD